MNDNRKFTFRETFRYVRSNFGLIFLDRTLVSSRCNWFKMGIVINMIFLSPACLFFAVLVLIKPMERFWDSFFIPFIPLVISPFIFYLSYKSYYKKTLKFDKLVKGKFENINTDNGIEQVDNYYVFKRNSFKFCIVYYEQITSTTTGKKYKKEASLILSMLYNLKEKDESQCKDILYEINKFLENRHIGKYIVPYLHMIQINVVYKDISPEMFGDIVDEMIYIAQRFDLSPLDLDK